MRILVPRLLSLLLLLVAGAAVGTPADPTPAPEYTVESLGPGYAFGINNRGEVVGYVPFVINAVTGPHAAVWRGGSWHDYGALPDDRWSALYGINDRGDAVGYSERTDDPYDRGYRAVISRSGPVEDLTALPEDAWGRAINDSGRIVGCRNRQDDVYPDPLRAYVLDGSGPFFDLHALLQGQGFLGDPSTAASCALDVNAGGDVVGYAQTAVGRRAFFYGGSEVRLLEGVTAGGQPGFLEVASGINDAGRVVGYGLLEGAWGQGQMHALVFDVATGFLEDLGAFAAGAVRSYANDVNGSGQAVGSLSVGGYHAFIHRNGVLVDLNTLIPPDSGWVLREAVGINDAGQIVGYGNQGYFLLNPLPNRPPTVSLEDASVGEGGSVTITATRADPDGDALSFEWDLDGDGTFEHAGGEQVTFSAAGLDGPDFRTIAVRITDEDGLTASASTTVTILNVAPTASLAVSPATVYVGETASVVFTGAFDPGSDDAEAGFAYVYDCTADGIFEVEASTDSSCPCRYTLVGVQEARGRIEDQDGGFTDYTAALVVLSPRQGVEGLVEDVKGLLATGLLQPGEAQSLLAKLEAALKQLDRGNPTAAVQQLKAFVNEVEALARSGRLAALVAQPLTEETSRVIAVLAG